ncbi:hypothetical protein DFJ74DRAFT_679066 [Hyaloraphidium curvatum]|nr:hypothetical protein DFJ74DRAFT_679066 [Hyaloraphidium curvatum]
MFFKEASLFLDKGPLEDGAWGLDTRPSAGAAVLHRNPGFLLVWRLLAGDNTLELRIVALSRMTPAEDYMDASDGGEDLRERVGRQQPVRLVFDSPVVPTVHFFEHDDAATVILCTNDGVVHRFRFPQPLLLYSDRPDRGAERSEHVISALRNRSKTAHPVLFHAADLSTSVIACNDGTLILQESSADESNADVVQGGSFEPASLLSVTRLPEHIMNPDTSALRRTLGASLSSLPLQWLGLGKGADQSSDRGEALLESSALQVVDMACVACGDYGPSFLVTICRDRKLRIWSLLEKRLVQTVALDDAPSRAEDASGLLEPQTRRLIRTFDRNLFETADGFDQEGARRGFTFKAAIHVPDQPGHGFAIYEGQIDPDLRWRSLDRLSSIEPPPALGEPDSGGMLNVAERYLVDFEITPDSFSFPEKTVRGAGEAGKTSGNAAWTLWALCIKEQDMELAYIAIDDAEVVASWDDGSDIEPMGGANKWMSVLRASSTWLELPDFDCTQIGPRSVSDVFLQHIFYPNRFALGAVVDALRHYARSLGHSAVANGFDGQHDVVALRAELCRLVEADAMSAADGTGQGFPSMQDLARNAELLKLRWTKLLNLCIESQIRLNIPAAILVDPDYYHAVFVVKPGSLSTLRGCEELDVLDQVYTGDIEPPRETDLSLTVAQFPWSSYNSVLTPEIWKDFALYLDAIEILYDSFPPTAFSAVEEDVISAVRDAETLQLGPFASELVLRHGLGARSGHAMEHAAEAFVGRLAACVDLGSFLDRLLSLLRSTSQDLEIPRASQFSSEGSEPAGTSMLAFQYTVLAVQQISESRHRTSWNLVIVLLVLLDLDARELVLPRSRVLGFLRDALEVLRLWIVLRWLCRETASVGKRTGRHDTAADAGAAPGLLWDLDSEAPSAVGSSEEEALISVIMRGSGPVHAEQTTPEVPFALSLLAGAWDFFVRGRFCRAASDEDSDFSWTTRTAIFRCALKLQECKLLDSLEQFVALMPNDVSTAFLRGWLLLEQNRPEKAADYFRKTASAFVDNRHMDRAESTLLPLILPGETVRGGPLFYNAHVSALFASRGHAEMSLAFARLALGHLGDLGDGDRAALASSLWHNVFVTSMDLLRYDDAYDALFAGMDPEIRKTCLERFVTVLSENQQVQKLLDYEFLDLHDELEAVLRFKAGNAGPFDAPNFSEILYSYYISKDEYQLAAATMYRHAAKVRGGEKGKAAGKRPSQATEVCHSLSLSMHALSLVRQEDAWFVAPLLDAGVSKRVGARVLVNGAESARSDNAVIRIDDVRRSYALASAKLLIETKEPHKATESMQQDAPGTLALLMQWGYVDAAASLIEAYGLSPRSLVESLVDQGMLLASSDRRSSDRNAGLLLAASDCRIPSEGTALERTWKILQVYVEKFEQQGGRSGPSDDRQHAISIILQSEQGLVPPPWLLAPLKSTCYQDLVRHYLKQGMTIDATRAVLDGLQERMEGTRRSAQLESGGRWFPYNVVDQVFAAINDGLEGGHSTAEKATLDDLRVRLVEAVAALADRARHE